MLTPDTKRHIDAARQVLVGKVPDPKSQIEQITNALVYKFMDDMDEQSAALGGKRRYFIGDYEKFGWRRLMNESLGAHDRLTLYREALEGMSKNPNLPELFRSIFRNAYLPFNDARTLTLFLKEVSFFSYENSEELGNGYEYLLSIMGSQGDAGQFRTPRHIIDFIVEAVNPTKDDSVLDPACGTAGFLISAYKHVMAQHDGKNDITGVFEQNELPLSADERKKLYHSYHGFDIDDNMVKMAKVNMYLHSFPEPNIIVHDSLSSEDYWNDRYDVILANPPFMSPKGGIVPHKKFGIEANRAEVLFVDYIASHLKPTGRAGIVVPEGIIFQSGKAYKELRKNLVENYLYAVISLPAGVFQPYSGVKTSIFLLDQDLTKQRDEILFVKIENDGFSLGSQRRPSSGGQLSVAIETIDAFKKGEVIDSENANTVSRKLIAENSDYNLSGDRYKISLVQKHSEYSIVGLDEIIHLNFGTRITKKDNIGIKYPVYGGGGKSFMTDAFNREDDYAISRFAMSEKCVRFVGNKFFMLDSGFTFDIKDPKTTSKDYVGFILMNIQNKIYLCARGHAQKNIDLKQFKAIEIPLPPIEIQREVVAELGGYQQIINAAQVIVKAYKPTIKINPDWEQTELSKLLDYEQPTKYIVESVNYDNSYSTPVLTAGKSFILGYTNETSGIFNPAKLPVIIFDDFTTATKFVNFSFKVKSSAMKILHAKNDNVNIKYVYHAMQDLIFEFAEHKRFWISQYSRLTIPIPSIELQNRIVAELDTEQHLIDANKKLIELYTKKITSKITELLGE